MGRVHVRAGKQDDPNALTRLDIRQHAALFVQQIRGHRDRQDGANLGAALFHGLFFDQAHDGER